MLFNSYIFILFFLPCVLAVYFFLARRNHALGIAGLFCASLVFYGWWEPRSLLLLVPSIVFNYSIGRLLLVPRARFAARALLAFGIVANLALLAFFKYADFAVVTVNDLAGTALPPLELALPLGISFFTFTQIAFLVDAYSFKARELSFARYGLFVSYFPHLIAGPVLHHAEMMPQFASADTRRPLLENFAVGLTIFAIGLFKKVVLADSVSGYVGPVFDHAGIATFLQAWIASLAFTVQIYFDFSGYSDMAIGLSRLFGIVLPLNFASPYKARNIIEFWRCWHMTLSRFLRDYLYIPLGGNRRGPIRRYVNLLVTMLLGGLWHGAAWTFVVWGGLHGLYLAVNHLWQFLRARLGLTSSHGLTGAALARIVTFLCVVIAWVFFRAPSVDAAISILKGMAGLQGVDFQTPRALEAAWQIGGLLLIAFLCPNTQEIMEKWRPALVLPPRRPGPLARLVWVPNAAWALAIAVVAGWALVNITSRSEFLYFRF